MAQVITLCESCAKDFREAFKVKAYPGNPTTEKKKICEKCRRKFGPFDLKQYLVSGKGAK